MFWSVEDFCDGFLKLVDHLELDKVRVSLLGWHIDANRSCANTYWAFAGI